MPQHATKTSFADGHGFLDLTGQKFGRWLLLRFVIDDAATNASTRYRWECRCDCGTIRTVSQSSLRNGSSKSCGCLKTEVARRPRIAPGESAFRRFLRNYRRSAEVRHLVWDLTDEQVWGIISRACHYCGIPPCQEAKHSRAQEWQIPLVYNGIDRRDNNIGYTPDNCLPCCKTCNWMKGDMGYDDFLKHVRIILSWTSLEIPNSDSL